MKSNGNLRKETPEETLRKAVKLAPMKKSGKEKQALYRDIDDEEEALAPLRRESALDYYDEGGDAWEETDDDDDFDEDQDEDWFDDDDAPDRDEEGDEE
jgi:hypothetical protein